MRNPNPVFSSTASEQLLCAWALQNGSWLDDLPVPLSSEHFGDQRYGALFSAIVALRAQGVTPTPDTLEAWALRTEQWTLNELFALHGQGRAGLFADFEAAARSIFINANRRAVRGRVMDAEAYLLENQDEDPEVMATTIESLFRNTVSGGGSVIRVGDMVSSYIDELEAGAMNGLRTGYVDFDKRHGSFMGGELIILAGEPGSGKTTGATNIARRWAKQGLRGHFASYEMGKGQVAPRMLSAISRTSPGLESFAYRTLREEGRGGVDIATLRECEAIFRRDYASLVIDTTPGQTIAELEASVRRTKRELGGLDFIIVDYLQRMRSSNLRADRHLQVAEFAQGLKSIAQRHNVPLIALSTMNRENTRRGDPRPKRSDLRESGAIEYEADIIVGVYRQARALEEELRAAELDGGMNDEEFFEKQAKLDACKNSLELWTLKARQGEEGVDYMHVDLAHDLLDNGVRPQRKGRA